MQRKIRVKIVVTLEDFSPTIGAEIALGESALEWFRSEYKTDWDVVRDLNNGLLKVERMTVGAWDVEDDGALFPDFSACEGDNEWTRYLEGE